VQSASWRISRPARLPPQAAIRSPLFA